MFHKEYKINSISKMKSPLLIKEVKILEDIVN